MNVYKRQGGLCLSSFEDFNVGDAGFQQQPWIANLDGIGVWTESGYVGGGVMNFNMTNSHSPKIVQKGELLVCSYAAPQDFQSSLFVLSSKMWTCDLARAFVRPAHFVCHGRSGEELRGVR